MPDRGTVAVVVAPGRDLSNLILAGSPKKLDWRNVKHTVTEVRASHACRLERPRGIHDVDGWMDGFYFARRH